MVRPAESAPHAAPSPDRIGLPWYDLPASSAALDAFYRAFRARWPSPLPAHLDRRPTARTWRDPRLLISQCCGPDLFVGDGANLTPFARPVFGRLDSPAGTYFSYIVGGPNPDGPLAINAPSSHSGATALLQWAGPDHGRDLLVTESHARSLEAVRAGRAAYAAIDAVTFELSAPEGVRVVDRSRACASPPFVTRADPAQRAQLFEVLQATLQETEMLPGLGGLLPATRADYRPHYEAAAALGLL